MFPILLFPLFLCIDLWGRLSYVSVLFFGTQHSNGYIFPFLLCLLFLFFSQLFVRPPQRTILSFCIYFFLRISCSLSPVQCHKPLFIVLQALSLIPWIYLLLPLYNNKGFNYRSYLTGLVVFPTFFNLSLNLAIRSSWLLMSHSQLPVLFLLMVYSFSIFGYKEYNQSDFGIYHLVMSMCRVFFCVVGRGCLVWPVCSLVKTLLAFALFILYSKAKVACYSSYLLTSYLCIPVPYDEKGIFWGC